MKTPSPRKEPTPPKRSALLPATIRRQGETPHQFLKVPMEGSEEGSSSSTEDDGSSSVDDDDDDGGDAPSRSPKHRRCSDTYDW